MLPLQNFLQAVLPSVGFYVTVYVADGVVKQQVKKSQYGVEAFCETQEANYQDSWFALASYEQGWHEVTTRTGEVKHKLRTQQNAMLAKSLWLDLDVGEDKAYKTRDEAIQALVKLKELGFPRPYVVGSGKAGLHVYYAFDNDVAKADWQYLADRLKQACKELGIHADPSRTADIASILRCPQTWNMKGTKTGGEPHQVKILLEGNPAKYDTYKAILDKFTPTVDKSNPLSLLPAIDVANLPTVELSFSDETLLQTYFPVLKEDYPTRPAIEVLRGCEQMRLQNGASEPIWRGMLATMRVCENGHYVAHKVSASDPRYSEVDTDKKLQYLEDNEIPPFTCDFFHAERPEVCNRCPYKGLIKTPISVPKRPPKSEVIPTKQIEVVNTTQAETIAPPQQAEQVIQGQPGVEQLSDFVEITTKNSKVNSSGCWVRTRNADGDWQWLNIYPYPIYPLQKVRGRTPKGETCISYIFRKHNLKGHDDIQIAGSTLMGQTLNATLGDYGFILTDKERKLMAGLLIDLLKETEHSVGEVQTTDRLGWNDTMDTFLLGNKLYKTDGKCFEIAVAGKAKVFSDQTVPQGSLETWKQMANVYNKDGLEWGQAVVASAFASPLMPLGALEKAALLFVTGDKGVGKSTALLLASSVYGNPERLMFNKMDTFNSRIHKLGIFSNITAAFDEMTDMSPKEASEFAYTLTQGRGKDRMGSGGEDLIMNTTYWSCLPVMSANDSIITALSQHGLDPTAQMSRVLEVRATDVNKFYTQAEIERNERLVRQLPHNYGVAGDMYMRYVTTNKDDVLEMIYQIETRFKKHANLNSNFRFWTYMCTRMIVGVMIANKLGLLDYNVAKLFAYLVKATNKAKAEIEKYKWQPETIVPQFLAFAGPHRVVVTHEKRPADMPDVVDRGALNDLNYVVQSPTSGRELIMRMELDTGNCIISTSAIKDWCRKSGIPYAEFINQLEQDYKVISKRTRRELGKQTLYRGTGVTECVIIQIPAHLMDSFDQPQPEQLVI